MARSIQEILRRRSDFSPFLVHLTRGKGNTLPDQRASARVRLSSILRTGVIRARNAHGLLRLRFHRFPRQVPERYLKSVCLTETPPEEVATLIGDISGRKDRLDKYGLVFSKRFIMAAGGSPVIYLCTQPGNDLANAMFSLIEKRLKSRKALRYDVSPLLPLIETFGPKYFGQRGLVDFHWEREWRVPGHLQFARKNVLLGLCDERHIQEMETRFPSVSFIDPLGHPALWGRKIQSARRRAWKEYLEPFP